MAGRRPPRYLLLRRTFPLQAAAYDLAAPRAFAIPSRGRKLEAAEAPGSTIDKGIVSFMPCGWTASCYRVLKSSKPGKSKSTSTVTALHSAELSERRH